MLSILFIFHGIYSNQNKEEEEDLQMNLQSRIASFGNQTFDLRDK